MFHDRADLDDIDRGLVHALHLDGRAPLRRIAAVLGVSAQTVARRYQRLRAEAGLRVVGLADPNRTGSAQWLVRMTAVPRGAQQLAAALVRRADTSWVKLLSGGTEIFAVVHAPADGEHALLLHDIPRTASVTAVAAHRMLHQYFGGPTAWRPRTETLSADQQDALRPVVTETGATLAPTDERLLVALHADGRAGHAELAAATGWSPSTVSRRLTELQRCGALFFDVELSDAGYGAGTQALLWLSVPPAHVETVADTLAGHRELAFVAATTGPANLTAHAVCPSPGALHHYLTHRLGALPAVTALETAPVLRTLKSASPHRPGF